MNIAARFPIGRGADAATTSGAMRDAIAMIGFGEAGATFASGLPALRLRAYDRKTDALAQAAAMHAAYAEAGVCGCEDAAGALAGAVAVLCVVTADQALAAAREGARFLPRDTFWFDMNSVAPDTKRAAARVIEAAGGRYVDVAIMAPVQPTRMTVPLLLSGPHAAAGADMLGSIGFATVRVVPGEVGRASSIKMIRSVMVKGIEALTAECVLAADRAGVLDEVLASLDASPAPAEWNRRADYNLDRMMLHGLRRAAEMEEVVKTLDALGTGSAMSSATVDGQRAIGARGAHPPAGLAAKVAALAPSVRADAA